MHISRHVEFFITVQHIEHKYCENGEWVFLTPLVSVDLINREKESSQIKILCFYAPPPYAPPPRLNDQGHIVFVLSVC